MSELVACGLLDMEVASIIGITDAFGWQPSRIAEDALKAGTAFGLFDDHLMRFDPKTALWNLHEMGGYAETEFGDQLTFDPDAAEWNKEFCLCICGAIKTLHQKRTEGA